MLEKRHQGGTIPKNLNHVFLLFDTYAKKFPGG